MINLFSKNHSKIDVSFIDSQSKTIIAQSTMPIEQLPESFELNTELNISDTRYSVSNAEPKLKSEFQKSGKLSITLTEIQTIDPKDILFSLPTVSDDFPPYSGNNNPKESYYVTNEDSWRQFEYVSQKLKNIIEEEFTEIRNVITNNKVGVGYNQIHVREKIVDPQINMSLKQLTDYFPKSIKLKKVSINNQEVSNSFSIEHEGVCYFGNVDSNQTINFLCINITNEKYNLDIAQKVATDNKLLLVHWNSADTVK